MHRICPDCTNTMHATYATVPKSHRSPGNYGRLQRIGSFCWHCRNFDEDDP